jgi:hypothetical protein
MKEEDDKFKKKECKCDSRERDEVTKKTIQ